MDRRGRRASWVAGVSVLVAGVLSLIFLLPLAMRARHGETDGCSAHTGATLATPLCSITMRRRPSRRNNAASGSAASAAWPPSRS